MKTTIVFMLWMLIFSIQASAQPGKKNGSPLNHNPKAVGYVTSFTLVDPVTDTDIRTLTSTDFIHAFTPINIRVNTEGKVKSMLIEISNAETHLDNDLPYTIAGDMNGDYITWIPEPGSYTITATPYNNKDAHGKKGTPVTIQLTVKPAVEPSLTLTLVNTETNQDIMVLSDMTELDMSQFSGIPFNIRADVEWNLTESVTLDLSGLSGFNRTDNDAPYTLISETEDGWQPAEGGYTITATAYSENNAAGSAGPSATISFSIKQPAPPALTSYVELNNLLVIYSNTNGGVLPSYAIDSIMYAVEETNKFYWRQSHMTLNIKWTVYVIDEYLERVHGEGFLLPHEVDADLRSRGFPVDSYDAVSGLVVGGGAYAYGVNAVLGRSGYFQVPWWDEHWLMSWFIVHEFHHILDVMFETSGFLSYPLNHPGAARAGGEYVPHSGSNWDLNAGIIKYWNREDWFALTENGNWGTIQTAIDRDSDTIPDLDPDVPLDEERFGTSTALVDTDGDGLTDLQEAMRGIFATSNPLSADTDNDELPDLKDPEPLYPINTNVPYREGLTLEQDVMQWPLAGYYFAGVFYNQIPASDSSSIHFAHSDDKLYIAARVPVSWNEFNVLIDADNDGIFYGKDNLEIMMVGNTVQSVKLLDAASVVAGDISDFYVSDLTTNGFAGITKVERDWTSFQLVIPKLSEYGLDLQSGEKIAVAVHIPGYAFLLERDELITLTLGEPETQTIAGVSASNNLKRRIREQSHTVYPNPAKNQIKVELSAEDEGGKLRILDTRGAERISKKITSGGITSIDINTLSPGLYLLYIESAAGKKSYKFIKQ